LKLSFHGADGEVTGSCHLVECGGRRMLIDCGLYQGGPELEDENARPFGFDPAGIDYVLLTHAHLDHCGRLPLLVKQGFRGEIVTTAASRELARLVMLDAGHLQEEDAASQARKAARHGSGAADGALVRKLLEAVGIACQVEEKLLGADIDAVSEWGEDAKLATVAKERTSELIKRS
jgi:metallo-beta-lactamase family protein